MTAALRLANIAGHMARGAARPAVLEISRSLQLASREVSLSGSTAIRRAVDAAISR
jgi:hypothetical protein